MTDSSTSQVEAPTVNGVEVDQLMTLITSIEQDHDNAKFQFRVNNRWIDGGHNRSVIKGFYADGGEDESRTEAFVVNGDEPAIAAGRNRAPNPMASCSKTQPSVNR